jgi:hypothetical protein
MPIICHGHDDVLAIVLEVRGTNDGHFVSSNFFFPEPRFPTNMKQQ